MGRYEGQLSTADRFQKSMQRKDSAHDDIEIRKANPVPRRLASNLKKIHKSTLFLFTLAPKIYRNSVTYSFPIPEAAGSDPDPSSPTKIDAMRERELAAKTAT